MVDDISMCVLFEDGLIAIWDVRDYSTIHQFTALTNESNVNPQTMRALLVRSNPTPYFLVCGGNADSGFIKYFSWSSKTSSLVKQLLFDVAIQCLCCSDQIYDGDKIWAGSFEKVYVIDYASGETLKVLYCELNTFASTIRLVGQEIWCGFDSKIIVWNKETLDKIEDLKEHTDKVKCLEQIDFDGGIYICSSSFDKKICLWDIESHACVGTVVDAHSNQIYCLAKGNRCFYSCSLDKTIKCWSITR
eukprot:TRINITY_DN14469_c0_g1_i1.p1 TRINITY_DN14469_c0_g1~~TRINITY_DN14469_c0_g1_i1.p1  ORF type:complete len:247 (-),score=17.98 TRINITY_DN14469_c0_g1_i1:2-742(-)